MQMKHLALVLLLATGCKKEDPLFCQMNPGKDGCPGNMLVDSGVTDNDAPDGAPDATQCFGSGDFAFCLDAAPPSTPIVFTTAMLDTTTSSACITPTPADWLARHPDACIVAGSSFTLSNPLDVRGSRPLVILSTSTIVLNASIDVASHVSGKRGPGSPSPLCPAYTNMPDNSTSGAGGGAGGSFITQGGGGGEGNNTSSNNGSPTAVAGIPTILRAGCDGQNGGVAATSSEGIGGFGGGAILLMAETSITIATNVAINASGAGAKKPPLKQGGGGGGGAGGMIALEAPTISAAGALLLANGGGGSSGGEDTGNGNAQDGEDPSPTDPTNPANGGTGTDNAGDGGDGWVEGTDAQVGGGGTSSRAGGGGGGGGGYIRVRVASGATSSPMEDVVP